jgi:chromate transporter
MAKFHLTGRLNPQETRMAPLSQLAKVFLKIGLLGFGGPFSLLTIMQKEVVERHRWLTAEDFTQSVGIGTVTPGPIFFATAIFVGYRLRGIRGAAVCGMGALLPSFLLVVAIAAFYVQVEHNRWVMIFSRGIAAGVVGLFISLLWKTGRTTTRSFQDAALIVAAFIALAFFSIDPIMLIVLFGLIGAWLFKPQSIIPTE